MTAAQPERTDREALLDAMTARSARRGPRVQIHRGQRGGRSSAAPRPKGEKTLASQPFNYEI